MSNYKVYRALSNPFPPAKTHFRVGPIGKGKTKPLAYIDARDVMDRLDEVFGSENWSSRVTETASGRILCELTATFPDGTVVTKTDGAGDTKVESEKGAISDALKRAAVSLGVGRYLYGLDMPWVNVDGSRIGETEIKSLRDRLPRPEPIVNHMYVDHFSDMLKECKTADELSEAAGRMSKDYKSGLINDATFHDCREAGIAAREAIKKGKGD